MVKERTDQAPSDAGKGSSHAGVPTSGDGAHVRAESRASVEADPSEPEHEGAEGDEGDIVGPKVDKLARTAATEDPGVCEATDARANLDRAATGVVEDAPLEAPAVETPSPAGDGGVDDGDPEEGEDHGGHEATALCDRAHQDAYSDSTELELEEAVEEIGDERRAGRGAAVDIFEDGIVEIANEAVCGRGGKGKGISPEIPGEDGDRVGEDDSPDEGERIFPSGEAGVKEGETGDHKEDAGRGGISLVE